MSSGSSRSTGKVTVSHACLICNLASCTITAHRLASLQLRRRVARSKAPKPTTKLENSATGSPGLLAFRDASPQISPCTPDEGLDPFIRFPVSKVKKSTILYYKDFFSRQGDDMANTNRGFSFDNAHLPRLSSLAMTNPALCMSCVAMSATFAGVHGRGLTKPDQEIQMIYSDCFGLLRRQTELEDCPSAITEETIMAIICLLMCCGIGFHDRESATTHWNGLQAFLKRATSARMLSGPLIAFVEDLEYWMVLMTGFQPRNPRWIHPIPYANPPPEMCGTGFRHLFMQFNSIDPELSSRLQTICLTSCRVTEFLENPSRTTNMYFSYLRGVLADQNFKVYSRVANTNTLAECLSIATNLCYLLFIRTIPWKAPLTHLCASLSTALPSCQTQFTLSTGQTKQGVDTGALCGKEVLAQAYLWILFLWAIAARMAGDQSCVGKAVELLRVALKIQPEDITNERFVVRKSGYMSMSTIRHNMRLFCWSDRYLARRAEAIYHEVIQG